MKLSPTHLARYKDVATLFLKYGSKDIIRQGAFDDESEMPPEGRGPEDLASDLEKLGPAFVKVGQLLSTRADLLPATYLEALSRLQDDVEPLPYDEIEKVIQDELGVRISKAFEAFDEAPIAAASLGQVHRATLRGGREVAVKVQRPGIRKEVIADLESLESIAEFLEKHTEFGAKYEVHRIVTQFRKSILNELDYRAEASHLLELRENLRDFPQILIPSPVNDYTTGKILTMDYLRGKKITGLSGAVIADLDGEALADAMVHAYLKQILVDGFFHADPHPGNLLLTADHRIIVLDLGMVGRLRDRVRDQLVHLLTGISECDGTQAADAALSLGSAREEGIDKDEFVRRVEDIVGGSKGQRLEDLRIGEVVMQVTQACAECGLRIPPEVNMLGKTLLNLDRIGEALCPGFDPKASIRRHLACISEARVASMLKPSNFMGMLTEAKQLFEELPARINRISEMLVENKMRVKVDTIDEVALMSGLQKIANRITLGLVIAAFIVGSAMLARIETDFKIMGYPGVALIFFVLAAVGGVCLLAQILFKDE